MCASCYMIIGAGPCAPHTSISSGCIVPDCRVSHTVQFAYRTGRAAVSSTVRTSREDHCELRPTRRESGNCHAATTATVVGDHSGVRNVRYSSTRTLHPIRMVLLLHITTTHSYVPLVHSSGEYVLICAMYGQTDMHPFTTR